MQPTSVALDRDLLRLRRFDRRQRDVNRRHSGVVGGFDLVGIDTIGQRDPPMEGPVAALSHMESLAIVFRLSFELEDVFDDLDRHVLFDVDARKLDFEMSVPSMVWASIAGRGIGRS